MQLPSAGIHIGRDSIPPPRMNPSLKPHSVKPNDDDETGPFQRATMPPHTVWNTKRNRHKPVLFHIFGDDGIHTVPYRKKHPPRTPNTNAPLPSVEFFLDFSLESHQVEVPLLDVVDDAPGGADDDVHPPPHLPDLGSGRRAAVHGER